MNKLGTIIKRFRYSKKMTLSEVCDLMPGDVSPSYLSGLEKGKMQPTFPKMVSLSEILGFSLDDIAEEIRTGHHAIPRKRECKNVPVISWVQAGEWTESPCPEDYGQWETWVTAPKNCSNDTFALQVHGDSMTSPYGPSFPDGSYIVVDPRAEAANKSMVVAMVEGTDGATFKQLIIDSPFKYLKPLNPQFPVLKIDREIRFIGKVVGSSLEDFLV